MPFQPSPNRDDGYDISDYYGVDPRLGTLGDFVELVRTATDRGLRVIVDLVVNHTSDEHPWFQEARSARDSPRRDWYVWRDEPSDEPAGSRSPARENSNWAHDEHSRPVLPAPLLPFQPDLNIDNPTVRDGDRAHHGLLAGARRRGLPHGRRPGAAGDGRPARRRDAATRRTWLRDLRAFVNRRRGDAMLLGEANVDPQQLAQYFGDHGDMLHMEFAFLLNQHLWLALARGEAEPLETLIRTLAGAPAGLAAGRPSCATTTS